MVSRAYLCPHVLTDTGFSPKNCAFHHILFGCPIVNKLANYFFLCFARLPV